MADRGWIRMAVREDASLIASVLYRSFDEYRSSYTNEAFLATTPTKEEIEDRMSEGPAWVFILADEMVGTVAAVVRGQGLYVRSMAVVPEARGGRIGAMLLKEVEHFALANGCQHLFLSTTPFLTRAIRLYEQFGFRRTAEGPHELFETPVFTMVKILKPAELQAPL